MCAPASCSHVPRGWLHSWPPGLPPQKMVFSRDQAGHGMSFLRLRLALLCRSWACTEGHPLVLCVGTPQHPAIKGQGPGRQLTPPLGDASCQLPTWLPNPRMATGRHTQAWLSPSHSLVLLCGRGCSVGRRRTSRWRHSYTSPSLSLPSYHPFTRRNFMAFLLHHVIAQIPWIALLGLWSVFPPVWSLVEVRDWA